MIRKAITRVEFLETYNFSTAPKHQGIRVSDWINCSPQLHMHSRELLIAFVYDTRLVRISSGPHYDSGVSFTLYPLSEGCGTVANKDPA